MNSSIMDEIGIDPIIYILLLFILVIVLIVLFIVQMNRYKKLDERFRAFMTGADGASLEEKMAILFKDVRKLKEHDLIHKKDIADMRHILLSCFQKVGIVKYDAFREMGGQLSFSIAMLDQEDNGFVMNSVHSASSSYVYTKEIENGRSAIELSDEEKEALKIAINSSPSVTEIPSGEDD
ncbi:MAG: DUF4446 family protein [Lachnospiraceae bacterium]|nr:DUF4446 family protein [Lachnospiraceae bacterium]